MTRVELLIDLIETALADSELSDEAKLRWIAAIVQKHKDAWS